MSSESESDQNSDFLMEDDDDLIFDDSEYDDLDFELKNEADTRKSYHYPFIVNSMTDIENKQQEITDRVANLLQLDKSKTSALLHAYKWHDDALIERYIEDPKKVLQYAGIAELDKEVDDSKDNKASKSLSNVSNTSNTSTTSTIHIPSKPYKPSKDYSCFTCCSSLDDDPNLLIFGLSCGHTCCINCYRYYLTQKIKEGQSRTIRCPGDAKCNLLVDEKSVKAVVDTQTYEHFLRLLVETFVDENPHYKWCPAPNCNYTVECNINPHDLNRYIPTVTCECGNSFCFGCGEGDHQPTTCQLAKKWRKKCKDDSETANWISANTKDCPKCKAIIEKDGGCNHMTCRKCHYHFCWICMGDWKEHGTAYYNCSRYKSEDSEKARSDQEKSRHYLERYLHYYNRYAAHLHSMKLEKASLTRMRQKQSSLQDSGLSWIEVQFLNDMFETLKLARHTLTWAYAFAFYLERGNMTTIFEDNQQDLEMAVENLSELFEKPVSDIALIRTQLMDKSKYVANRRVVLLDHACKGLAEGSWEFNVSLDD